MRFLLVWLGSSLIIINNCIAQDSLKVKNETTVGFLLGQNNSDIGLQHYSGVFIKDYNIEAGIVLGYDKYEYFTINPIGVALKTTLFNGKNVDTVIGFNAGLGFFFFQDKEEQTKYQPQLFTNPNLSFRFGKTRKVKFNVNVGYKTQNAKTTTITPENNDTWWPQPATKTVGEYNLQRVIIGVGLSY
ncbi:MAG TPA: hypothetical protein VFM79_13195 [Pelobium sp.]|nr:hypothetical protein [Pelobium sp.]